MVLFVLFLVATFGGAGIAYVAMSAMVRQKLDHCNDLYESLGETLDVLEASNSQLRKAHSRIRYAKMALADVNVEYFGPRACIMAANTALDGGHTTGQEEGERSP